MKAKNNKEYSNSKPKALNFKFQTLTSNQRGITLIALVVTIIVLLILAGVTINIVFSDNGIIKRAQSVGATQKNAEIMEKLELIKANLEITKRVDGKITEQDYFNGLKEAGIISDPNIGGDNIKELPEEDGKKKYEVITDDGEVLEIEFPKDEDEWPGGIKVEYGGTGENLPPSIRIKNTIASTNSITLEVEVTRIEAGDKISYYYKKHTDTAYTTFKENVTDQTINIEGLEQGQTYIIKIVASNANGQTTKETQGIPLGELEEGTISILSGPTWVGDGTATLELQTTSKAGYMEYKIEGKVQTRQMRQIDDTGWTKYTGPITGLRHNNIVLARLSDGTNATIYEYPVEIIDEDDPMPATGIENIETTANTNTGIEVTIVHNDDKSGIDLSSCRWVYNTTDTMLGIESEIWDTANEFTEGEPITLTASTPGEYYLHILSVDSAGNRIETMSEKVTINQPVTKITLSRTSASLTTGSTTTIKATLEPENATNKTINWTTSNSSRATVSPTSTESGESVTVRASSTGSVTITATTADGTNLSATCSVSVSAPTVSVTGISVSPTSVTLDVGGTKSLTATISPQNATNQGKTWSSSNNRVKTENGGTVKAVAPGPATITVKASGNTSKTATCSVSVNCSECSNTGEVKARNHMCTVEKISKNTLTSTNWGTFTNCGKCGKSRDEMTVMHMPMYLCNDCGKSWSSYKSDRCCSVECVNALGWGVGATRSIGSGSSRCTRLVDCSSCLW